MFTDVQNFTEETWRHWRDNNIIKILIKKISLIYIFRQKKGGQDTRA